MAIPIIYWIENEGPGRLAILARPPAEFALPERIRGWKDAGIDVVVSMLTESDNEYLGLTREAELCNAEGLEFVSYPIQDFGVPDSIESARALAKDLHDRLAAGKDIGFHCNGCIGRAPLMASCVLMLGGKSAAEAFDLVSLARGYPIPEGRAQAEWGRNFEREIISQ